MSFDISRGYDSFFGPPSEPISIRKFLDDTVSLVIHSVEDVVSHRSWQGLSEDERAAVEAECSESVSAVKADVEAVWNNPRLSAHLRRAHAEVVNAIHSQAGGTTTKGRKHKYLPDPGTTEALPEVRALQKKLDAISLQCWCLNQEAAFFMRASKHSDFNAFKHVKKSGHGTLSDSHPYSSQSAGPSSTPLSPQNPSASSSPPREALITLTVYNRVPWVHSQLIRFSQHAVLSSQTLADLVRVIPCDSSEMPTEQVDGNGNIVGFAYDDEEAGQGTAEPAEEGYFLLIEAIVYGDGRPGEDYADKLLTHLQKTPEKKTAQITKSPTSLSQTSFASLTLRINQPYWMLHQGNCDHFIVVDQIRLVHPSDPPSGYPLTLHVTPALGDFCKACAKVPAVLAVVGDIRLGESPCLLCAPCWRNMGPPRGEANNEVVVVPLVRHRRVWEDGEDT